jgi:hypothetical protein
MSGGLSRIQSFLGASLIGPKSAFIANSADANLRHLHRQPSLCLEEGFEVEKPRHALTDNSCTL